jgi:hypothetical protein
VDLSVDCSNKEGIPMRKMSMLLFACLAACAAGCGDDDSGSEIDSGPDAGDTDSDSDSDTDSDTDSDSDSDSDSDAGTDDDAGTDTDTQTDTGSDDIVGIGELGTDDLSYDGTVTLDPRNGLPLLENVDPACTPSLGDQELPDGGPTIHDADKARSYVGYPSSDALAAFLRQNGVARQLGQPHAELVSESLQSIAGNDNGPGVLLTADAVFNTFHNFFDNLLLGVELRTLRPQVIAMLDAVKIEAARRYNALPDGPTREAALDVVAYLQTAQTLMDPEQLMIAEVQAAVEADIATIMAATDWSPSAIFDRPESSLGICATCDPCPGSADPCLEWVVDHNEPCPERMCEDFTQYRPRGHYTYNEQLKSYFRAVMWLGRMTFLNRSDQSTRGAVILVDSLKSATAHLDGGDVPAMDVWRRFFRVVGTFVGSMDDLNVTEIDGAIRSALGATFSMADLDDDADVTAVQEAVGALRDPQILGGYVGVLADAFEETKGLRLLGQVFLPDSYATGQLVYAEVGPTNVPAGWAAAAAKCSVPSDADPDLLTLAQVNCICAEDITLCRTMPSGLDVAAVLGSPLGTDLALARWDSYGRYGEQLAALKDEFAAYGLDQWGISVAWTWLYALTSAFADPGAGMPPFMRTDAWRYKALETGLTSWAEMRHDTILYVKQSYTGMDGGVDAGVDAGAPPLHFDYVEPQSAAYARLAAAARRLEAMAGDEGLFLGDAALLATHVDRLAGFLERASTLSVAEAEGNALAPGDIAWIQGSGTTIEFLESSLLEALDLMDSDEKPDPDRLKVTIVADVHTDPHTSNVLEVGSAYLENVAVLHRLPTGEWGVAVGPAFSYRELPWPMDDRLTDEKWRDLLEGDAGVGRPEWLGD